MDDISVPLSKYYNDCTSHMKEAFQTFFVYHRQLEHEGIAISDDARKALALFRIQIGRFKVWGENIGVHRGGISSLSLDYRLRDANHVRDRVVELMRELDEGIKEVLSELEEAKVEEQLHQQPEGEKEEHIMAPSSVDTSFVKDNSDSDTFLHLLVCDIAHIITCLYKLSIVIRRPADRTRKYTAIDVAHYEFYDKQHAKDKFPKAPEYLVVRLGKANNQRRKFFIYHRAHHEKIKGSKQTGKTDLQGEPTRHPGIVEEGSQLRAQVDLPEKQNLQHQSITTTKQPHTLHMPDETRSDHDLSTVPNTYTTMSAVSKNAQLDKQLTVGDIFEVKSEVGTVTSYATSKAEDPDETMGVWRLPPKLKVPSPPILGDRTFEGTPFMCPYCCTFLIVKSRRSWMQHVYTDLRPYVCTFEECSAPDHLFGSRQEWFDHEIQYHRREWFCEHCDVVFCTAEDFSSHLEQTHADFCVDKQHREYFIRQCERPVDSKQLQACQLCGINLSETRLKSHLAGHMQQLALSTLPRFNEEEADAGDALSAVGLKETVARGNDSRGSTDQSRSELGSKLEFDSNPSVRSVDFGESPGWHDRSEHIAENIRRVEQKVQEEKVSELLKMLSPLEPLKRHQDVQPTRLANTGTWLLELPRFQHWRDGAREESTDQGRILCCYGMPGGGKTILSSLVIDHIHSHSARGTSSAQANIGIACLYCDYRDQGNQTLLHIVGSFLQQLLLGSMPHMPHAVDLVINTLDDIQKQHKNIHIHNVLDMLKLVVQQLDYTYIIVDALDELDRATRKQLLKVLKDEFGNARLFLTGRYHIQAELSTTLNIKLADHIDIKANPDDIRAYLIRQIEADINPGAMNERLQDEILTIIPARSQGMFLLPALHIAAVLAAPTIAKRRKALENLPSDLYDVFQVMIARIQQAPHYAQLGMQVLMWLHLAYWPLKLKELAHALAVGEDTELDEDNIPSETAILVSCNGLVIVDDETSTVRFVHYTLGEFFRKYSNHYFPDGFSYAAEICLRYLNFDKVRGRCFTRSEIMQKQEIFPFLQYAALHWGQYVKQQNSESVSALALGFIGVNGENCHYGIQALYDTQPSQPIRPEAFVSKFSGIHAAAYFGLENIIGQLSTRKLWDSKDNAGRTPLSWAALNGHEMVVRLLVDSEDVVTDSEDMYGNTPLSLAAMNGHESVVRLLVDRKDVVADSRDNYSRTPLSFAAMNGHEHIVRLLVDREDVVADSKDMYGRTPLSLAVMSGHEGIVRLLVDREDVVADSKDNDGNTPLSLAAMNGHEHIVQLLVDREDVVADPEDKDSNAPLSLAAMNGHESIVQLLVDREDVVADSKDMCGNTPLSLAAMNGHESVVRLLVDREDVMADSRADIGNTPLSLAAKNGHEDIVRLLVDREDVVADSKNKGNTPLSLAAKHGHESIVRLLVGREDVVADSKSMGGNTPLSLAAINGHEHIVRLLVDREDVMADSKDNNGNTPLSLAAMYGHEDIVQLLVDRDDVVADSKDNNGNTPLSLAAMYGHKNIVQLLKSAMGDSKDSGGRTSQHM